MFCPGRDRFSWSMSLVTSIELMRIIVSDDRWNLMFIYCFFGFFLKTVRVCAMAFSITVAWTSTKLGWTSGLPINVKSSPPATRTYKCRNVNNDSDHERRTTVLDNKPSLNAADHQFLVANSLLQWQYRQLLLYIACRTTAQRQINVLRFFHALFDWPYRWRLCKHLLELSVSSEILYY